MASYTTLSLLDELERAQEDALGGNVIASFEVENLTPALVGSWTATNSPRPGECVYEPPRPTDIAGKMRWWLRLLIAANRLPNARSIRELDREAAKIMGAAGRAAHASRVSVRVVPLPPREECVLPHEALPAAPAREYNRAIRFRRSKEYTDSIGACAGGDAGECYRLIMNIPRVNLATMGSKECAFNLAPLLPGCYRFRVDLLHTEPHNAHTLTGEDLELAAHALNLALRASGIGRMITRGFGT